MSISYNAQADEFEVVPDECPHCENDLYDSGCAAAGCPGAGCQECGWGCDLDFAGEDGECARSLAEESDAEIAARIDEERGAFGLAPVAPAAEEETRG